jgi:aminoglycoside 3-N-acetyltransferase
MTLLVHSSLSALGWVSGGAQAVVMALEAALGPWGTLVMPTHSTGMTEPSYWQNPPVPESWWPIIRETMPAFDPDLTPSLRMGAIPECFRKQPGALRSNHPHSSFAARGAQAALVTRNHALDYSMGDGSPLARLYELDAWVLLLGVGHDRNTSLHLAECRADYPGKRRLRQGGPVAADGGRTWATFDEWDYDDEDFPAIGAAFADTGLLKTGRVGAAEARLMPQAALVDFAARWMTTHRTDN